MRKVWALGVLLAVAGCSGGEAASAPQPATSAVAPTTTTTATPTTTTASATGVSAQGDAFFIQQLATYGTQAFGEPIAGNPDNESAAIEVAKGLCAALDHGASTGDLVTLLEGGSVAGTTAVPVGSFTGDAPAQFAAVSVASYCPKYLN